MTTADETQSATRSKSAPNTERIEACVMCAADLSPASQRALATAAELAEAFDAKLLVVHAVELWDRRYDFLVSDLAKKLTDEAEGKVAVELAHLGKTEAVPVEVLIRHGPAIEQLIKVVMERKPLMLVVGCNSSSDPNETHLGCMAQELIRLSPVSVVVTRPGTSPDIKRILCAVGGGPDSDITIEWALDMATRERIGEIAIVNTYEVPTGYLEAGMTYEEARSRMLELHQADVKRLIATHAKLPVRINALVEEGSVPETVARIAGEWNADLLVVGSERRSFLAALLLGRRGLQITSRTRVSVALVKSKAHRLGLLAALERL